ncbi:MAG: hypothetical protein WBI20_15175, partial [Burkholderiaceae bacterium]
QKVARASQPPGSVLNRHNPDTWLSIRSAATLLITEREIWEILAGKRAAAGVALATPMAFSQGERGKKSQLIRVRILVNGGAVAPRNKTRYINS